MIIELILQLLQVLLLAAAVLLVVVGTIAIIYTRWEYGSLENLPGLPAVVKPSFLGGSDPQIHTKVVHESDNLNVRKYGKLYGFYEGRQAQVHVADPDLVRQIFIKDFDHFQNKRFFDLNEPLINEMMDLLPYKKWKSVRNFLTPILSTGKIKNMSVSMTEAAKEWMGTVKDLMDKNGGQFESKKMFAALTVDVIARCGFGTKVNSLHDTNNPFVKNVNKLFHEESAKNFITPLIHAFPFLMKAFPMVPPDAIRYFAGVLRDVMNTRRASNIKANDFVDTLNEMKDRADSDPEWKDLGITENTVTSQAILFFMAAFRTTTAALSFFSYTIATNPEVQEKLREEVDAFLMRHKGKIHHENLGELEYLSVCMQETLRLYPPVIRIERVCTQNWSHPETGLKIPKGMVIQVPLWSIHHSEDYYENAKEFKPERFLSGNKDKLNQSAFISFGMGPHNCVGMRLAKEEIVIAMVNLLQQYKFVATEKTKLKFFEGNTFTMAVDNFWVKLENRN